MNEKVEPMVLVIKTMLNPVKKPNTAPAVNAKTLAIGIESDVTQI